MYGFSMKILSFNIRGLGSSVKKKEIKDLIARHRIDFCCVQETKLDSFSDVIGRNVWGGNNCDWAVRNAEGRAGGILSIWNSDLFSVSSSWHMSGALIFNGLWGVERIP